MKPVVVSLSLVRTEGLWRGESSYVEVSLEAICAQVGGGECWEGGEGAWPPLAMAIVGDEERGEQVQKR